MRLLAPLACLATALLLSPLLRAAEPTPAAEAPAPAAEPTAAKPERPKHQFTWQTGKIELDGKMATIDLPESFRFIGTKDSRFVLEELWGNPASPEVLGMVFPADSDPTNEDAWAVVVTFEESGYVKDDDAKSINYDDLLKDMQESTKAHNEQRVKAGYSAIELLPWGEPPSYDAETHKMFWAKRLRFGDAKTVTLNYNVRALGRKGVLVLNAVSSDDQLKIVASGSKQILAKTEFTSGNRYEDFSSSSGDKVAAYGIAGLVAGGILLKSGFFKLLLVFIKPILIGGAVVVGVLAKIFMGRSAKKDPQV